MPKLPFFSSKTQGTSNNAGGGGGAGGIVPVRVIKTLLEGETHPEVFKQFGEYQAIGGIFYSVLTNSNPIPDFTSNSFALPLFPNLSQVPLENEVVYIIDLPSNNVQAIPNSVNTYYFQAVNIWGSVHHNAIPDPIQSFLKGDKAAQTRDYQQIDGGLVRRVTDGGTEIDLGDNFNERIDVRNLQPYEGDIIHEGRWGQSIRFGSTVSGSIIPNSWSNSGLNGDPVTIIRNGQHEEDKEPWIPQVEDINKDASSIYLTSTQLIPISGSSTIYDSYFFPPTKLNEYSGEQIILNSGRLVLNSKSDSIMLSSFNTIGLNSVKSVNVDSPSTVIKSKSIALGDKNASEPMILGNKFLSDFEDLCNALSTMADVLAKNPVGGPGNISIPIVPLTPAATKLSTLAANMLSRITEYKSKTTTSK